MSIARPQINRALAVCSSGLVPMGRAALSLAARIRLPQLHAAHLYAGSFERSTKRAVPGAARRSCCVNTQKGTPIATGPIDCTENGGGSPSRALGVLT